eukprot:m.288442 g.288442  ORF g.288442 m.288442 type:complete len:67 (+) comp200749_c0_seq1:1-201(+)
MSAPYVRSECTPSNMHIKTQLKLHDIRKKDNKQARFVTKTKQICEYDNNEFHTRTTRCSKRTQAEK